MKYTMLRRYHLFFIWIFCFQLVFPVHVVREKFDILLDEDTCPQYRADEIGDKCICHQTDQTVISYDAQYYTCAKQTHAGCYLYIDSLDQSGLVEDGELYKQIYPRLSDQFNTIHQVLIWNYEKYVSTSWYDVTTSTKKFFQLMPPPPGRTEPYLAVTNINMLHWKGHLVKIRFGPYASNEPCLTLKFKGERRYPFDISEFEEALKELPTTTKSTTTSSTTTTTTTTTTSTMPTTSTTTTLKTTTKLSTTTPATTSSTTTTTPTTTKTTTTTRTTTSTPEATNTTTATTTETSTKRSTWSKSPSLPKTKTSTLSTLKRSTRKATSISSTPQNTTSVPPLIPSTTQKSITPTSLSATESGKKEKEGKIFGIIPTKIFYTIIGCVVITLILSITACSIRRRKRKLLSKRNKKNRAGDRGQVYEDVTESNINKHKNTASVDGEGYLIPNQPSCPPLDDNLYECSKSTPQTLYSDLNKFNVSEYSSFDRPPITEPCYSDLQSRDYMVLEYEDVKIEQKPSSFTEEVDYFEIEPDY